MPLDSLRAAIARMFARGTVTSTDDSASPFQRLEARALYGEAYDDVERLQPYGLTSHAEPGAQVLLLEVGGARDHVVALLVADERHRPTGLAEGEVALHGKDFVAVRAKPNGDVVVEGGSGAARVTVAANGDVTISGGAVTIGPGTTIDGKDFLTHTHAAGSLLDSLAGACSGVGGPVV